MRAVVCRAFGPPDTHKVEEIEPKPLEKGQVRIAVAAAGVNFADTLMITGKYQEKPPFPFIPGMEAAGVVREVASDVTTIKAGDRVAGTTEGGAFTELSTARAADLHVIPDNMDFVTAASFPVVYGTSEVALNHRAHLKAGETLLVLGAAGGVGLTAVEIGKAMGATVIAAARGTDKLAITREHGADHVIDYASEDLRARVKEITGDAGANVVFDPVGGDMFDAALRVTAWEGRILVIGFAAGRIPQVPANLLLVKNIATLGVYWGAYRRRDPRVQRESFARLFEMWRAGKLKPHVSYRLPLEKMAQAMELLLSRKSTGKVVLTVNDRL